MRKITNIGVLVLLAALPTSLNASQQALDRHHEKTWEGTLAAVDTQDNTVKGEHSGHHPDLPSGQQLHRCGH